MAVIEARDLCVKYGKRQVVHEVSLGLSHASTVGLIGESGSGKTTILRAVLGLVPVASGELRFEGEDFSKLSRAGRRRFRSMVQPVFQDGSEALNPRFSVETIIGEAARAGRRAGAGTDHTIAELLDEVGLDVTLLRRRPHELSGGQRQRIAIARALAVGAEFLMLDEPTSALDVSVQGRIVRLLQRLQRDNGLGYLLISHNLGVVRQLCEESLVLKSGRVEERGSTDVMLAAPKSEYARRLRDAIPRFSPEIIEAVERRNAGGPTSD